jgi:hypothetical protein
MMSIKSELRLKQAKKGCTKIEIMKKQLLNMKRKPAYILIKQVQF